MTVPDKTIARTFTPTQLGHLQEIYILCCDAGATTEELFPLGHLVWISPHPLPKEAIEYGQKLAKELGFQKEQQ